MQTRRVHEDQFGSNPEPRYLPDKMKYIDPMSTRGDWRTVTPNVDSEYERQYKGTNQISSHQTTNIPPSYPYPYFERQTMTDKYQSPLKSRAYPDVPSGLKPRPEGILESFGLIRSIPILDIIWIISILSLILTVEFNLFINFNNEIFKGQEPLVGITILGFLLGLFFSYIHYEFKTLNIEEQSGTSKSFRDLIKISVLILIGIFVIIVMVLQLLDFRGMVAIIDSLGIMAVTCGTYGILVKNRVMIIPIVLILVVIGVLKVNYSPDILLLILLSGLALFYILISDTSIQYYLQIKKIRDSYKSSDLTKFDLHYDRILTNYLKFLTLFILLSTLIVGFLYVLNRVHALYSPSFISENLEFQTVYGLLPPLVLFIVTLFIIWAIKRYNLKSISKKLQLKQ